MEGAQLPTGCLHRAELAEVHVLSWHVDVLLG